MKAITIPAQSNSDTTIMNLSALPRGTRCNPKRFDNARDRAIRVSNSGKAASVDLFSSTDLPKFQTLKGNSAYLLNQKNRNSIPLTKATLTRRLQR
jgi:hypothetical protein